MPVLVAISDLFFSSKIDAALAASGGAAERAKRGEDLLEQVRARRPERLLVELASRAFPAMDVVRAIKADPDLRATEIVGYCRHTSVELIREAKSAGIDRVLTQGEFSALLPVLLAPGAALPKGAAHCD